MEKRGELHCKGQVSVFIVIGVLLLVGFSLFFYVRSVSVQNANEPGVKVVSEEIPRYLVPIKNFVQDCISTQVKSALEQAGLQGGYIADNLNGQLELQQDPTESNAVQFPNKGMAIPYYYYLKSPNDCRQNCQFASLIPPLCKFGRDCMTTEQSVDERSSIESQIEEYIKTNLPVCLGNFDVFTAQNYDILSQGKIEPDVMIRDGDVFTYVKFPIKVKQEKAIGDITEFQTSVTSPIKEIYEVAYNISNYEATNCFLETNVHRYYSTYYWDGEGSFEDRLPPGFRMTIGDPKIAYWVVSGPNGVGEKLKKYTQQAVKTIGVFNTLGFKYPEIDPEKGDVEFRESILDNRVVYTLGKPYDVVVTFDYFPFWNPYLTINPGGQVLLPTMLEGGLIQNFFGTVTSTRIYEFYYDYSFPTLVQIRGYDAATREEYLFQFALEGNIRANACFTANTTIRHMVIGGGLLCERERQVNSVDMKVTDLQTNEPLSEVKVSFYAGETCTLGSTDADGKLTAKYPDAFGGVFVFNKDGYVTTYKQGEFSALDVQMRKISNVPIQVQSVELEYTGANTNSEGKKENQFTLRLSTRSLSDSEQAIISVKKVVDEYDPFGTFPKQFFVCNNTGCTPSGIIKLIPGKFEVDISYFTKDNYIIIKGGKHICEGGFLDDKSTEDWYDAEQNKVRSSCCNRNCPIGDDCTCESDLFKRKCCSKVNLWIPQEDMEFIQMGGLKLNEETRYWEVTQGELDGIDPYNVLTFLLIKMPKATSLDIDCLLDKCITMEDASTTKLEQYSLEFFDIIKPGLV